MNGPSELRNNEMSLINAAPKWMTQMNESITVT